MATATQIDLSAWAQTFESSAEWRRDKAKEYPADAGRHISAANELDSLAAQFEAGDVDSELVAEYEALGDGDHAHRVTEVEGELKRQVGFGRHLEKADDFIRAVLLEVRGPKADVAPVAKTPWRESAGAKATRARMKMAGAAIRSALMEMTEASSRKKGKA